MSAMRLQLVAVEAEDASQSVPMVGPVDATRIPRFLTLGQHPTHTLAGKARCPVGRCGRWLKSRPQGLRHLNDDHGWILELQEVRAALQIVEKPHPLTAEETRAKRIAAAKAQWARPETRAKRIAAAKAQWARPETRAKRIAAAKAQWARPETRAKRIAAAKAQWARPETRAKLIAALNRPETRAKARYRCLRVRPWESRWPNRGSK